MGESLKTTFSCVTFHNGTRMQLSPRALRKVNKWLMAALKKRPRGDATSQWWRWRRWGLQPTRPLFIHFNWPLTSCSARHASWSRWIRHATWTTCVAAAAAANCHPTVSNVAGFKPPNLWLLDTSLEHLSYCLDQQHQDIQLFFRLKTLILIHVAFCPFFISVFFFFFTQEGLAVMLHLKLIASASWYACDVMHIAGLLVISQNLVWK